MTIAKLTCAFFAFLLLSCANQQTTVSETEPDYFVFGSGGGFTGKYVEYRVFDSGMIDEMDFDKEAWVAYAEVEPSAVRPFFTELAALDLMELDYEHPGNLTWYIEVHDEEITNRVKWGDFNTPVKPELEAFFKKVNDFVLDLKK